MTMWCRPGDAAAALLAAAFGLLLLPGAARASTITWTGEVDSLWSTELRDGTTGEVLARNWSPALPIAGDDLFFDDSAQTTSRDDYESLALASIAFAAGAPSYTLVVDTLVIDRRANEPPALTTSLVLTGAGVVGGTGQSFVVENQPSLSQSFDDGGVPSVRYYTAGVLSFAGSASAGDAGYTAEGGFTVLDDGGLFRLGAGAIVFESTASAGTASFATGGGAGDGGRGASIDFHGDASAAGASFSNAGGTLGAGFSAPVTGFGGQTAFHDDARAGTASFANLGSLGVGGTGGRTTFSGNASADTATFTNHASTSAGGAGGATGFAGTASAASASFENRAGGTGPGSGGRTDFSDASSAGTARFVNRGASPGAPGTGGSTRFFGASTAGDGVFENEGATAAGTGGSTQFFEDATAGRGTFVNQPGPPGLFGYVEFHDGASGGEGSFENRGGAPGAVGGAVVFRDRSSAGDGRYANTGEGGTFLFHDFADAGRGTFTTVDNVGGNSRIEFFGDSSAADGDFTLGGSTSLVFHERASGGRATIRVGNAPDGSAFGYGVVSVQGGTLGEARITAEGGAGFGAGGGNVALQNAESTAGDAEIVLEGGSAVGAGGAQLRVDFDASAGQAHVTARGGTGGGAGAGVSFARGGRGDGATIAIEAGAFLSLGGNVASGTSIGSLAGGGSFLLGGSLLTTGGLGADTEISGVISDGGSPGGRLTKAGTGRLTLSGANTYTGLTTVAEGILLNRGSLAGDVQVGAGATFASCGSSGSVAVANGGTLAPGCSPGTMTVANLRLEAASILDFEFGVVSDLVVVEGDLTLDGILNVTAGLGLDAFGGEIFTYGGTLIDNGLEIGSVPAGFSREDFRFDFSQPGRIGLQVVPEAQTGLLLAIGLAAVATHRRCRPPG